MRRESYSRCNKWRLCQRAYPNCSCWSRSSVSVSCACVTTMQLTMHPAFPCSRVAFCVLAISPVGNISTPITNSCVFPRLGSNLDELLVLLKFQRRPNSKTAVHIASLPRHASITATCIECPEFVSSSSPDLMERSATAISNVLTDKPPHLAQNALHFCCKDCGTFYPFSKNNGGDRHF